MSPEQFNQLFQKKGWRVLLEESQIRLQHFIRYDFTVNQQVWATDISYPYLEDGLVPKIFLTRVLTRA